MNLRVKHLVWPLALVATACDKGTENENAAEIATLRAQIAELAERPAEVADPEKGQDGREAGKTSEMEEEIAKLKAEITALRGASDQMEKIRKDLEKTTEEKERLEKKVEELEEANEKLNEEVTMKIRQKAVGEKHETIEAMNGRVFKDVVIRSIDDDGVSISHSAGLATLRHDSAPEEWVRRFRLVEKPDPALEPDTLADGGKEGSNPQRPGSGPSEMNEDEPADLAPRSVDESPDLTEEPTATTAETRKILESHFNSIVIIDGNDGTGSGFILNIADRSYLYTAAHVICGNTKLTVTDPSGRRFTKFGTFEAAEDCDLARIEILEQCDSGITLASPDAAKVREPVLAIGQSGGAGVLTVLEGNVISLGPKEIEVSADVIQGNSGGPLFHGKTGEVLAVVTHLVAPREDIWAQDTGFDEIRRFATRLDRDFKWQPMPIGRFISEKQRLESHIKKSRVLFALSVLQPGQQGLRLPGFQGSNGDILTILAENTDEPAVAKLIEMNREMAEKKIGIAKADLIKTFRRYYHEAVRSLIQGEETMLPDQFSGYNRERARLAAQWRGEAVEAVEETLKSFNP